MSVSFIRADSTLDFINGTFPTNNITHIKAIFDDMNVLIPVFYMIRMDGGAISKRTVQIKYDYPNIWGVEEGHYLILIL